MQKFSYQALDENGGKESGVISTINEASAVSILRGRGLVVLDL
ncbi:MAG: hypothetical protein UV05_C0055G0001, partial [candidate division CPR1 bacterium GW2011_GWA2_42_17]